MMLKIKYTFIPSQVLNKQNLWRYEAEKNQAHLKGQQYRQQVLATLNKQHRYNILTPTMIDQIIRFLDSYALDDAIKAVWFDSDPTIFSKGTDLKYLKQLPQEQKGQYLKKVQELALYFGTYQKPIIPILRGEVSGSMSSMMSNIPFTLTQKASLRWNEIDSDFLPHGGASYVLSRLPYEIGVYLALTGKWLSSQEAMRLGLIYGELINFDQCIDVISEVVTEQYKPRTTHQYGNQFYQAQVKFDQGQRLFLDKLSTELLSRIKVEDANLVISEIMYKYKKFQEANILNKPQIIQELSNPLVHFKEHCMDTMVEFDFIAQPKDKSTKLDTAFLSRCLSANSIKEIKDRLKEEQSSQAQLLLEELNKKSEIVLQLTLQMIRQAEKLQWRECLDLELQMCNSLVQSPLHQLPQLKYALQPVKEFYQQYPDNIRYFLNEENLRGDMYARLDQEIDVLAYMENNKQKLDGQVPVAKLRQMQSELAELKRDLQQQINKLKQIIEFPENLKQYIQKREQYIQSISEKDLQQYIDNGIKEFTNKMMEARFTAYEHIANIAQVKQQRDLFSNVRNAILNKKLASKDASNPFSVGTEAYNKLLVFPKDDKDSFLFSNQEDVEFDKHLKLENLDLHQERGDYHRLNNYKQRYGDPLQDFQEDVNNYYNRLLKQGDKCKNIKEYLQQKETSEILEHLKNSSIDFNLSLKDRKNEQTKESLEQLQQQLTEFKQQELIQLNEQKSKKRDLFTFITEDEYLKNNLLPLFEETAIANQLRHQFESLLQEMYKIRMKKINQIQQISVIDTYINKNIEKDAFKLIESNLLFNYSYVCLMQLDDIYEFIKSQTSSETLFKSLQDVYGFRVKGEREFKELLSYLNKILNICTNLYNNYRTQIMNKSDQLLDAIVRVQNRQDGFISQSLIYKEQEQQLEQQRKRHLNVLDGQFDNIQDKTDILEAVEQPRLNYQVTYRRRRKLEYEKEVFYKLDQYMKGQDQEQKELLIGIQYYLRQIDLIAAKQTDIQPSTLLKQKQDLQNQLQNRWFQYQSLNEWFPQFIQRTIGDLYYSQQGISEFQYAELLESQNFKEALLMELRRDQQTLEYFRTIFGQENDRQQEIQETKYNPVTPALDDLAMKLTVAEHLRLEGIRNLGDMEENFRDLSNKDIIRKEAEKAVISGGELEYRQLQKLMMNRIDKVVEQWSKQQLSQEEMEKLLNNEQ